LKDELVELQFVSPLSLHLSMSQVVENTTEPAPSPLRLRTVVCSRTELPSVCNDYEDLLQKQLEVEGVGEADQVVLRHQRTVWQLIDVLFSETPLAETEAEDEEVSDPMETPDDSAQILIRRAGFSRWLQESVSHMVQQDLEELKGNKYLKEIFTLLTGRKLDDAVEIALERGDVRMATLLSQAGGPIGMRSDVAAQLEVWASEGLDKSLIESDRLSVYQLLAGDLKGSLAGLNIDWKRFMGLVMWYQLKPDTDLPYLIETFEGLLENDHAPKPVPKYVEERVSVYDDYFEAQGYDTAYYLMLLHAKKSTSETSVRRMLSASASTFDRLDQKLAWHQQGILHAIRMLEAEQLHEVHMNFASQLLSVGLCHWAVYVILHMPSSPQHPRLHEKAVKEILNQYCEIWSSSETQQRFLEEDLSIPTEWIHEALALYWRYMRDNKKELEHLIKSRQWRNAHVLFMTTVAASLFLNSEHSEIWQFASQLEGHLSEVEDWDLGAGIYIEFLTLKSSFLDKSNPVEGMETVEERTAAAAAFFERLKESQALWKSKSTLDIRVAYARMADEISSLLLGESKTQSVDKNTEMKMFDVVLDAPVPEDVRMCRLQGALSAFTNLLSDEIHA
jgi:nuclear pore complex protein Nup98-Nup96